MKSSKLHLADVGFLVAIVLCTALPWAFHLGFYSDDWVDQQTLQTCPQPIAALLRCFTGSYRPLQYFQLAMLYKLFGSHAVGYHVYNSLLLLVVILGFHAVLRRLSVPPPIALAVPLLYALLPHFSTDRFWIASFQANLCMALYLGGVFAVLKAFPDPTSWSLKWAACAAAAFALSAMAYEVAVPLFLLVPILAWRRLDAQRRKLLVTVCGVLGLAALIFKLITQTRHHFQFRFLRQPLLVIGHIVEQTWNFNGHYGLGLPATAWRMISLHPQRANRAHVALLCVAIFSYLFWRSGEWKEWPSSSRWLLGVLFGLAIFLFGYAPFMADVTLELTTAGVQNRVTIAASIGMALCLVSMLGLIAGFAPTLRLSALLFSAGTSFFGASGFVLLSIVASYWTGAVELQNQVRARVAAALPTLTAGTSLILDGVCAWDGPAVIFESTEDVSGMLQLLYRNPALKGDIATAGLRVQPDGLHTFFYSEENHYAFGEDLLVLDVRSGAVTRLTDYKVAKSYFDGRSVPCPPGRAGYGGSVF